MDMQNAEEVDNILASYKLDRDDLFKFLSSEPGSLALARFAGLRSEAEANGKAGAIQRIITQVEFSAYPLTDESGHYIAYKCSLCGTKAKVRTLKRTHAKRAKDEPRQEPIPGTEG